MITAAAVAGGCAAAPPDDRTSELRPARTVAHEMLALEETLGESPAARERLDAFLAALGECVPQPRDNTAHEALALLAAIGKLLAEQGYTFTPDGIALLSESLERQTLDCDTASYLYLAAGERLGLPISGVMAPRHFFVRWQGNGFAVDWETTLRRETSVEEIVLCFGIEAYAIRCGAYLRSLTRGNVLALSAAIVATEHGTAERYREAISWYDRAIAGFPALTLAYTGRARCFRELGEVTRAHEDLDVALALDPASSHAYSLRTILCMDEGKFDSAIDAATDAIGASGNDPELYSLRAAAYRLRSAKENSIEDLIKAVKDDEFAARLANMQSALASRF